MGKKPRFAALPARGHKRAPLLLLAVKGLAAVAVAALLYWNVAMLARLAKRVDSDSGGRLRGGPAEAATASPLESMDEEEPKPWFLQPESYVKESGCDFSSAVGLFKPEQLEINCGNIDELLLGEFIGAGFWREVYKASWKGREIAVKVVKQALLDRPDIIPRHVEESAAIFPIRDDPNIVSLVGWCDSTVIVDYIPHQLNTLLFESEEPIPVRRSLELARDAARGVAQLHSVPGGPFAHADLQARQFLIDANGTLKLNDFNRIKFTGPQRFQGEPTGEKCTFRTSVAKGKWRSPEEYALGTLDEKLDIYSLSLVLWALRARAKPYMEYTREDVYAKVPKGLRPPVDAMGDYPKAMRDLIVRGWDADPTRRPSAREMADEIDRILQNYEE